MANSVETHCELLVVGAGMAGMAASAFAVERGIDTVQVGLTGEIIYASGLLDVMGVHPVEKQRAWSDPWAAIEALRRDEPRHPYARLQIADIRTAVTSFMRFLEKAGLPYRCHADRNTELLTPVGTVKMTYGVPAAMWSGTRALEARWPCLIVDFKGLKGFSARQIESVWHSRWPGLRGARLEWPETRGELYAEQLARQLELPQYRRQLADMVTPLLSGEKAVGFPAVLGVYRNRAIVADLEERLGRPVFEIPTLPPAVTGTRLKEAMLRRLTDLGVRCLHQMKVLKVHGLDTSDFAVDCGEAQTTARLRPGAIILASGRFIGQGLAADRKTIHETIFDLPVHQPDRRADWHRLDFLDPRGHAVNRSGIETDDHFRPLGANRKIVSDRLFAIGSILAHQDWIRMKCGSGLAIASAYGAVQAYVQSGRRREPSQSGGSAG